MSGGGHDWTPDERLAEELVKRLPRVAADPEFRERLRREFRSGRLAHRRHGRWRLWTAAAVVLIAVSAVVVFSVRDAGWTVIASEGAGTVRVDGRPMAAIDTVRLAAALGPGTLIETDARTELRLVSADTLALVVTANSVVRLPAVPGQWWTGSAPAVVARGELRGVTGRRFTGRRLRVELPDAAVEISGTTFAVIRNAEGSCVCVLEGTVTMRDATGTAGVMPLHRRVVPPRGEPPRDEPIRTMERMKLEMLRNQAQEMWDRRQP